jgi:hypothetical protein
MLRRGRNREEASISESGDKENQAIARHEPWLSYSSNNTNQNRLVPLTMIPVSLAMSILWSKKVDAFFAQPQLASLTLAAKQVTARAGFAVHFRYATSASLSPNCANAL